MDINEEIGKVYGRLTILSIAEKIEYFYKWKTYQQMVNCQCECGNTKKINLNSLRRGRSTSCGCVNSEVAKERMTTHGMSTLPNGKIRSEYNIWKKMRARCNVETNKDYIHYGGRGIKVCNQWMESFEQFYKDMGDKPAPEYSIERKDVNGNYEPGNCIWIPQKEQTKNIRKNQIEYKGEIKCLNDWCKELNLKYSVMRHRIYDLGISLEEAMKHKEKSKVADKIKAGKI